MIFFSLGVSFFNYSSNIVTQMSILTYRDWEPTIDSNIQNMIIILFTSSRCDSCEQFQKNIEQLLEELPKPSSAKLFIADIDTSTELVDKFNITIVPTTLVINKRKIICRVSGAKIEELQKKLV
jgi:thioredoxin-like negative regulator of GroEL